MNSPLKLTVVRMNKSRRKSASLTPDEALFAAKQRKPVPHEFVLEAIAALSPRTRPMFGCLAVYVEDNIQRKMVEEKIVFILRDKDRSKYPRDRTADNGVWLATTKEHHESLRREFPNMRSIEVLGRDVTGWQVLPADAPDFEESALRACELVLARDARIGKVPGARGSAASKARAGKGSARGKNRGKELKKRA